VKKIIAKLILLSLTVCTSAYGQTYYNSTHTGQGMDSSITTTQNLKIYNIKDYGAKVDGVTDDRAAIQAAIYAAGANNGGIVLIPPGTMMINTLSTEITVLDSVTIQGSGMYKTFIKQTLDSATVDMNFFVPSNGSHTEFRDFTMIGYPKDSPNNVMAIHMQYGNRGSLLVDHIRTIKASSAVKLDDSVATVIITNCDFSGTAAQVSSPIGIFADEGTTLIVKNTYVHDYGAIITGTGHGMGIYAYQGVSVLIEGCTFKRGKSGGVQLYGGTGHARNQIISNCVFDSIGRYGILAATGDSNTAIQITNCSFTGPGNAYGAGYGVYANTNNTNVIISGCSFALDSSRAVAAYDGGGKLTMTGCTIRRTNNEYWGVQVDNANCQWLLAGNTFIGSGNGLVVSKGVVTQTGNTFLNGATISVTGTGIVKDAISNSQKNIFNVVDYGAMPDSSTDCTIPFMRADTAAYPNGTVVIPPGAYKITNTVTIRSNLDATGANVYISDTTKTAWKLLGNPNSLKRSGVYHLPRIFLTQIDTGKWFQSVGVRVENINNSQIDVPSIRNFGTGLMVIGIGAGVCYNTFNLYTIYNNRIGVKLTADATGWSNENVYIGGSFTYDSDLGTNKANAYHVMFDSTVNAIDNNVFIKPSFEGNAKTYDIWMSGVDNTIFNARWESTTPKIYETSYSGGTKYPTGNEYRGGYNAPAITFVNNGGGGSNRSELNGRDYFRKKGWGPGGIIQGDNNTGLGYPVFTALYPGTPFATAAETRTGWAAGYDSTYGQVYTETYRRWKITNATGEYQIGPGSSPLDTKISRSAASTVQIDTNLHVVGGLSVDGFFSGSSKIRGNGAFTTTSVRAAVYVAGLTASDMGFATPRNEDGTTLPVAGDFMSVYCKTDSVIVLRVAGTTSGEKFNWMVLK
jgi:hypothetical protein